MTLDDNEGNKKGRDVANQDCAEEERRVLVKEGTKMVERRAKGEEGEEVKEEEKPPKRARRARGN
jgi:hypothetical protein